MVHSYLNLLINLSLFLPLFHCVDSARVHKWAITIKCEQQKMHFAFLKYSEISLQFVTCFGHGKCQNAQMAKWQVASGNWQLATGKCQMCFGRHARNAAKYVLNKRVRNEWRLLYPQPPSGTEAHINFWPKKTYTYIDLNVCVFVCVGVCCAVSRLNLISLNF